MPKTSGTHSRILKDVDVFYLQKWTMPLELKQPARAVLSVGKTHTSYTDAETGARVYVADAHKDGQRCVARGETLLTAYLELRGLVAGVDVEQAAR